MATQPQNPTPYATASMSSNIPDLSVPKAVSNRSNKSLVLIILLFLFVIGLSIGGYYFLIYRQNQNQPETNTEVSLVDTEYEYQNDKFGFTVIVPKLWEINQVSNKVIFYGENDGVINLEVFDGEEFQSVEKLDKQFCESFETGFREGLSNTGLEDQFNFEVFNQNGLDGCQADGLIVQGYYQKYNVFFDPTNKRVLTMFYTLPDEADDTNYERVLNTFKLITQ